MIKMYLSLESVGIFFWSARKSVSLKTSLLVCELTFPVISGKVPWVSMCALALVP